MSKAKMSKAEMARKMADKKKKTNLIIIISVVAALLIIGGIILGIALSRDDDIPATTIAKATLNPYDELVFTMSDGAEINAGAMPANHENTKIIGITLEKREGREILQLTCSDTESGATYIKGVTLPSFADGTRLMSARIDRWGELIFSTNKGEINAGKILYLSTPAKEMTPSGKSEYADTRDNTGRNTATVEIKIKGYGTVTVLVDANTAPQAAEKFISLAKSGAYSGVTFNKIVGDSKKGYVQGRVESTYGGVFGEFSDNGYSGNDISHKYGTISLYHRDGEPDGSVGEFFICTKDSPELDGRYASFGYVISGMNIIEEIAKLTKTFSEPDGIQESELNTYYRPNQAVIESVTVVEPLD